MSNDDNNDVDNHDDEDSDDANNTKEYSFSYKTDTDGFLRVSCSSCGLPFKIEVDAYRINSMLGPTFARVEREYDLKLASVSNASSGESERIVCPYCGHPDNPQNMNTDEFQTFAWRWVSSEVVHPILNDFLSDIADIFDQPPKHSGGMFSLTVDFEYDRSPKPLRPIAGPEPSDMLRVHLLCCNKHIKILEPWCDRIFCPYCSLLLILQ